MPACAVCAQSLLSGGRILDRAVASNMAGGANAAIEYSYASSMAIVALIGTSANIFLAPRIAWAIRNTRHVPRPYWTAIAGVTALAIMTGASRVDAHPRRLVIPYFWPR